jgi:hypothetical protein
VNSFSPAQIASIMSMGSEGFPSAGDLCFLMDDASDDYFDGTFVLITGVSHPKGRDCARLRVNFIDEVGHHKIGWAWLQCDLIISARAVEP